MKDELGETERNNDLGLDVVRVLRIAGWFAKGSTLKVSGEWHGNSVQMHGQQLKLTNLVRLILCFLAVTADFNCRIL